MRFVQVTLLFAALIALLWVVGACDDIDSTAPDSNVPPVTTISGGPTPFDEYSYLVDLKWFGEDMDGSVDTYEFAWDDTSEWFETVLTGSTFVVSSDTCCIFDTLVARAGSDSIVERYFRYHTFFIRSVDDKGVVDPSPAHLTFNSITVAPESRITKGPPMNSETGRAVSFRWEGFDPDSPNNAISAFDYFHATKGQLKESYFYLDELGITRKVWNSLDWIRVGADTTSVVLRSLETGFGVDGSNHHFFFVRSIDEAGAVEQLPVQGVNYRKWGASNFTSGSIIIRSNVMGVAGSNYNHVGQIFEGTRIIFSWTANLGSYDGTVTGYSHAYDGLIWSAWDLEANRFPPEGELIPERGRHSFFARAKDEAGEIIPAEFPLRCSPGPRNLDTTTVLVLNNFHIESFEDFYPPPEKYQKYWTDSLLINFNYEFYDPRVVHDDVPPIRLLSNATTVILPTDDWEGGLGSQPLLAEWHADNVNPLWSYVDAGGNVLLLGFYPSWNFLPDNDFLDTGVVPVRDPCFWSMTPKSCGSSLIWHTPQLSSSFPHPLYEYCAIETTWLDETADFLWGAKKMLPNLPDLHVNKTRSKNFRNNGLWLCERFTYRDDRGAIPIYGYSRSDDPLFIDEPPNKETVAVWVPSDGLRGHVVYMGMPVYFFEVAETRDMIETILTTFFGETMKE